MSNELLFLIEILTGAVIAMLGWYAKEIKQELDDARKEITSVQINYVHKEELKQFRTEVMKNKRDMTIKFNIIK